MILDGREKQVITRKGAEIACEKNSLAGSVSQRACVFCGSRVVLYPIADAIHLVHGPIGCAAYTWDIRGSLSSGPEFHRLSFSTDLKERDVIYGGEKKLRASLIELIAAHKPKAAFVYSTCIVGIIGDDVGSVCRQVQALTGIPVVPVHSEGFKGTKKDGYRAACDALYSIIKEGAPKKKIPVSINIIGEFNLAGEAWIIRDYYRQMGIHVVSVMTGDGRIDEIRNASAAMLNVVQCSGSMIWIAKRMEQDFGIPYKRVSYFGIEDSSKALYDVAEFFDDPALYKRTAGFVAERLKDLYSFLKPCRRDLKGKRAAIYVGGAFKAFSLIKSLRNLGIETVVVGSQTGNTQDYALLSDICKEGTVILDDSNPYEMSNFIKEKNVDIFIGGVKERYMALKLGIGFCDHNHERKTPLAGFEGMKNFAKEVYASVMSPVWQFCKEQKKGEDQP
ncbi:MAG: nitrogenase iron-molybdenum cofactor biosynthesis protein NifE [Spirochaetales bacterium]|nr:nitrogenase iron-molybdenum cofactor biosynthesis protein NifE [Spirochaetales bacterium]